MRRSEQEARRLSRPEHPFASSTVALPTEHRGGSGEARPGARDPDDPDGGRPAQPSRITPRGDGVAIWFLAPFRLGALARGPSSVRTAHVCRLGRQVARAPRIEADSCTRKTMRSAPTLCEETTCRGALRFPGGLTASHHGGSSGAFESVL